MGIGDASCMLASTLKVIESVLSGTIKSIRDLAPSVSQRFHENSVPLYRKCIFLWERLHETHTIREIGSQEVKFMQLFRVIAEMPSTSILDY